VRGTPRYLQTRRPRFLAAPGESGKQNRKSAEIVGIRVD
jgi:hypothetical protein